MKLLLLLVAAVSIHYHVDGQSTRIHGGDQNVYKVTEIENNVRKISTRIDSLENMFVERIEALEGRSPPTQPQRQGEI